MVTSLIWWRSHQRTVANSKIGKYIVNDEVINNRYGQLDFDDKKSRPVHLIGVHHIGVVCCSYDKNVQWKLVITEKLKRKSCSDIQLAIKFQSIFSCQSVMRYDIRDHPL